MGLHTRFPTSSPLLTPREEISTNRLEDQEISMLCLHLLQNCLVYVNTLMLQRVLEDEHWRARMTRKTGGASRR